MRGNKRTFPNFHPFLLIPVNSNLFITKPWREDDMTSSIYLNEMGCLKNNWISFGNIPILKLYATQWFSREKIKWLLQIMKYELGVSKKLNSKFFWIYFQFGMLCTRSSCISYFLAFWSILEISRNSRTLGESWRFRYFHIWEFSRIWKEDHLIYLIHLQLFFRYQIMREGIIWLSQNIGKMKI